MNKLFTKVCGVVLGATLAFGVGLSVAVSANNGEVVPVHAAAGDSPIILDGTNLGLSSTATTSDTEKTYGGVTYVVSTGAKTQAVQSGATKNFTSNATILIGKSGTYIYNKTAIPGEITKFEVYANKGASAKVSVGVNFSATAALTSWNATGAWTATLFTLDSVYDASSKIVSGAKYFRYQVTNANNSQVQIRITYESGSSDTTTALSVSPNSWTGYDSQTINVSNYTVSCTSTKSPGYEFQGIGSVSGDNFVARVADFTSGCPTTADTRLQWKAKYPTTAGGSTYLYAYVSLTVTADSVNSIAISGSMTKTTYNQGDAWDPTGFTVNAFYASAPSTPVNVTNSVSWTYSPATTASTSTTSVTCTASFGGKSATSSAQSVTVNEKQNLGGLKEGRFFLIVGGHVLKASTFAAGGADTYTTAGDSVDGLLESDAWYFAPTGTDNRWTIRVSDVANANYLYATNTNNGLVSGGTSDSWTVEEGTGTYAGKLLMKDTTGSRYISYTTSANSYVRVYTNTNNGTCSVEFIKYEAPDVLDSDLTLTGKPVSLTAGSLFPGVTKAEAEYSKSGTVDVTSNVTYTLGGTAIAVGGTIPANKVGASVEVVVTYTDVKSNSATASFNVPVVNKPVTSVSLNLNSATIAKGGTVSLTATVSDEFAIQTVKWTTSNSSIATLSSATSTSGNAITVTGSSSNSGTATITAYVDEDDSGTLNGSEKYATCSVTVSADPVLNMFDEDDTNITSGSITKFTTDSNFYLNVVAENFQGAITYTWSSSNTSVISVDEEADEMCMFVVDGAGSTRISCNAVGATSGNLTVYVDVTVTEPVVTDVTWSAPASLSVYDNAQLTTTNISSWSPVYEKDNGDIGSITSNYVVKLGGETITLSHDWLVSDDGKELWIEYGGIASSHVTVQVTEHLNAINYSRWQLATSVSAGDVIVIGNAAKGEVMTGTGPANGTLGVATATISEGVISDLPSDAVKFTVGGTSGAYTLVDDSGKKYLSVSTTAKTSLYLQDDSATTAITFSDNDAVFGDSSGYRIVLNASASPHRFSTYNSTLSASMVLPQIYKSSTSNIADTNVNAQRALISFAKTFNTTMACYDGGDTANIASKWSSASSAFTTALGTLSSSDQVVMKRLAANASSVEGGDTVQDMLARYDYIVAKYKIENDFLHSLADRGAVQYARVTPLNIVVNNGNTVAIIVVISMISVTAIGGYFFIRRRKEEN